MRTITKRVIKTAAKVAAAKALAAGSRKAGQWAIAADAALVKAGEAAKMRQRKRTTKHALKTAGKIALVTGAAAATVVTVRAVARNARRGATAE